MGATIRDVAARAGVSVATASRAFSGTRAVRPDNREKVARAAEALGYQPDVLAAALRSRTTRTVGMVVPTLANPFFAALVEAVQQQLGTADRCLLLGNSAYDPERERRQVRTLTERQVDALVLIPCDAVRSAAAAELAASRVPCVQLDLRTDAAAVGFVGADNEAGVRLAMDHLARRGARRPCFIGARPTTSAARERCDGFLRAAALHPADTGWSARDAVLLGDFSHEWGAHAAERVLRATDGPDGTDAPGLPNIPDAIVCGNDMIALGVLRALSTTGLDVPGDVQVTGFDDTPYAALAKPGLTTVRQPLAALAGRLVGQLDERAAAPSAPPQRVAIAPDLVARGSTRW